MAWTRWWPTATVAAASLGLAAWSVAPAPRPSGTAGAAASAMAVQTSKLDRAVRRTGVIAGWQLFADGTLYVQLRHDPADGADGGKGDDAQPGRGFTWFESPPDKNLTTFFEDMLLEVVLSSRGGDPAPSLTLFGEQDPSNDGSSLERAITLISVMQT